MAKLHNKDFQIAFKTGSDANKSKFAKECVQGELYLSDGALYIADSTAGANDASLFKFLPAFGEATLYNTEAALFKVISPAGYIAYAQDTGRIYISNGSGWAYYNRDLINKYYLSFDGVDDYLDAGNITALNSTSAFTISMWINFENVTGSVVMSPFTSGTSTSSRIEFVFNNINELRFGVDGSVNSCTLNISSPTDYRSTDAWHNIIGTYDGTNVTLFFDGSQVATTTTSVPSTTSSTHGNDTTIGRRTLGGGSFYFNGLVDEVAIWGSVLSASDITSIYNNGTPNVLSSYNPVGWWRMGDDDGGAGTTITGQGSGGNDATLQNGPTFSTDTP